MTFSTANSGALYTLVALTATVLSLAAVCATILHILKGKRRSTGKQKELQRPFIKRKLASPSGTRQTPPPFRAVGAHAQKVHRKPNDTLKTGSKAVGKIVDVASRKIASPMPQEDFAEPRILSNVMATLRDQEDRKSPELSSRQPLSPEVAMVTSSPYDNHSDASPANTVSSDKADLSLDASSFEGMLQNPFILERYSRSPSASPPESRLGNLSNQGTGYLLGSRLPSSNETDHSYCQLRDYAAQFDTPPTTVNGVYEFDDETSLLDVTESLVWEELSSGDTTESSYSPKNSISSFTDLSQTSKVLMDNKLRRKYEYPKPRCLCPEMMTFGMTDLWSHRCNGRLGRKGKHSSVSSQDSNERSESPSKHEAQEYPVTENGYSDSAEHNCEESVNCPARPTDSLVNGKCRISLGTQKLLSLNAQRILALKANRSISESRPPKDNVEAPLLSNTVNSSTPTSNCHINRHHPPVSYCDHALQHKLGDKVSRKGDKGRETEDFEVLHLNHSHIDSRRWYSLGSLCDDNHGFPNDVIKHDYAHTHGHELHKIDLESPLELHNDTGYTSPADIDTDSPARENHEIETGSYDADYDSDDVEENPKPAIVRGVEENNVDDVVRPLSSIGEALVIDDYAKQEWKGETTVAETMRKGYAAIPSHVNCRHLRQVRGDNYCAIRATLFQALLNDIPVLSRYSTTEAMIEMPQRMFAEGSTWIQDWSFAGRMKLSTNDVIKTIQNLLIVFVQEVNEVASLKSRTEKVDRLLSVFNADFDYLELKLLEAVKFLMICTAVDLYKKLNSGEDVPIFAMLMFARDTSPNPQELLQKHLNCVGDSGGLEQVEMHLLGYALSVVIQVIRPSQVDKEDFIVYYPSLDDAPSLAPSVTLVAEDDRHYNIIM